MKITDQLKEFKKRARMCLQLATTDDDEWRDDIPEDLWVAFVLLDDILDEL